MNLLTKFAAALLLLAPLSLCAQRPEPTPPVASAAPLDAAKPPQANPDASGLYKVGGEVSAPKVISRVDPEIPFEARRERLNGVCVLSVIVDQQGKPQDVHIIQSAERNLVSFHAIAIRMDESAIKAVKQYRFKPALYHKQPVPVEIHMVVDFHLH